MAAPALKNPMLGFLQSIKLFRDSDFQTFSSTNVLGNIAETNLHEFNILGNFAVYTFASFGLKRAKRENFFPRKFFPIKALTIATIHSFDLHNIIF